MKLTGAGQIFVPEVLAKETEQTEWFKKDWGKIVLIDYAGRNYVLYVVNEEVDLGLYELPPAPMAGMFDIRFGSGRIVEDISNSSQTIELSGVEYDPAVKVENIDIRLQDEIGSNINVLLKSGEDVVINDAAISKLSVSLNQIPEEYALEQNYPNPFNPSTKIKYSIPSVIASGTKQSQLVTLKVYDLLGNEVATLINEERQAGSYEIQFDASGLASGIYLYKIESGSFIKTKKMILLK